MKSILQVVQNLLKPYIDNHDKAVAGNIAPVETNASSASKSYTVGKQLILNGVLYDVIAAISAGDALAVNTNIAVADNISDTISALAGDVADKADKAVIGTQLETIGNAALYAHASGTKFYATNGNMYKASANIAVSDTLTVGTNCALDNVIKSFNDVLDDITGKEDAPVILTQTLTTGATSLTFTNAAIGNNSRIKYLSNPFVVGLIINAVQSGTSVTLTCEAQASDVSVIIEVFN